MDAFNQLVLSVQNILAGYVLLVVLVGAGIWFTVKTGFVQIKEFGNGWRRLLGGLGGGKKDGEGGLSSFQAVTTAIAGQVGTGNIAGVATAIAAGGPGAVFWMWVSAFLGMATIFCEAVLAQATRKQLSDGSYIGGPVYYIREAYKGTFGKVLAGIFAVLIALALGLFGNAVQANSISDAFHSAFFSGMTAGFEFMGQHVTYDKLACGIVIAALALIIFAGGVSRIGSVTEKLVPIMAIFYLIGGLIIVIANFTAIPYTLQMIFVGAFNPRAVAGGAFGIAVQEAVKLGIARGLFNNEAGLGSTPNAHAQARVDHPVQQGQLAIVSVFICTMMLTTLTAIVIIITGMLEPDSIAHSADGVLFTGVSLTQAAFGSLYGSFGNIFIAIAMFFFAFSTVLGWYFYGESNIRYLFGKTGVKVYLGVVCVFIIVGSLAQVETVWNLSDCFNSMMVIPNILGVLALTKLVQKYYKDYKENFCPNHPEDGSSWAKKAAKK